MKCLELPKLKIFHFSHLDCSALEGIEEFVHGTGCIACLFKQVDELAADDGSGGMGLGGFEGLFSLISFFPEFKLFLLVLSLN